MSVRGAVVLLAILIALRTTALALDGQRSVTQYAHTHYSTRDGMPHGLANSIVQTGDGYLWTSSEEGLARFDGAVFTTFDHRKTEGIPANAFTALAVDSAGTLWAGSRERGLVHLVAGEFRAVAWSPESSGAQIRALAIDRRDFLWAGTRASGIVQLQHGALIRTLTVRDGLPSDDIRALLVDRDGTLWIGTYRGLARWGAQGVARGPALLDGVAVHAIAQAPDGVLWCATERGLVRVTTESAQMVPAPGLADRELSRVLFDRNGNLWIGTEKGLARRTPDGRIELLAQPAAMVLALSEDAESNLWIGSEKGLDRLLDGDIVPFGAAEGMTDEPVFGVREDPTGALWFAASTGLLRVEPGKTTATVITENGTMYSIFPDHRGDVWFGARDGSVGRWRDGRFAWLGRRSWERVRAICETSEGLWFGTNQGLFRLRGDRLDDAEPIIPGSIISMILPAADGALWLGTEGQGLLRWQAGKLAPVPSGGPPATSSVVTLEVDATDHALWVGTEGEGLWRLADDQWQSFTTKDGMFDDVVWRMFDDGLGRLWFSSNRGIWRVNRSQLVAPPDPGGARPRIESVVYGEGDGMRDRECNGAVDPAGWRTRDGRMWFPTGRGLAVIDPTHLVPAAVPTAVIESVLVDGRPQALASAIAMPPGSGRLEISYTAPALRSPERLRFRYHLEGFDRGWNDAGSHRVAQYTNLAPGRYRFVVEAGLDGAWGQDGAIAAELPPLFYQTRWFFALVVVGVVLLIVSLPLLRVHQLRTRARELDARVQEAVRELKVLSGMLPICAWCKKIRDDKGYWSKIEAYLSDRTDARFTHGICPECNTKLLAEEAEADAAS